MFHWLCLVFNAVLELYEYEKNQNPSPTKFFLLTNRLCQDPLENLFSINIWIVLIKQ